MANEINLLYIIPLCLAGFALWVGFYLYITLTVIRHDPREVEFRKKSGKKLGLLPDELFHEIKKEKKND